MSIRSDAPAIMSAAAGAGGQVVLRPKALCNGVKVFAATRGTEREVLGERVTAWLQSRPQAVPIEFVVTQSSDAAFHCVTITVFYREALS